MRLATCTAGSLVLAGLSATVAYAFLFIEFAVFVTLVVILIATGLANPSAKKDKIVQKATYQMVNGFAFLQKGDGGPDSLNLNGNLTVKKARPEVLDPPTFRNFGISFPVTKTNSRETKGSLKARNEELSGFRSGIENLLSHTANLDTGGSLGTEDFVTKTRKDFVGGGIQVSDSKQSGSVKVDTKTFTRLAGSVNLKGNATVSGGTNSGYDVKYKIKVKFKPRKQEF
jgi:hypothetical protein